MLSNQMTVAPLTTLKSHENREDLVKWWGLAKCLLKNSRYKDVMFKTWLAKNADANRGFKEVKKGEETISAEEQSALVQDMLETITSYLYTTESSGAKCKVQGISISTRVNPIIGNNK